MKFSRTSHAGARRRARVAALLTALGCTVLVALAPGCSSGGSGAGTTGGKAARGHGGKGRHGKAGKGKGFLGRSPAGPPPAAPPAAAPKPAPALPELPELAAQAKTDAPAKAPAAESKCGDAAMGEVTVPLDCLDGDDKLPHPLKPLVPYATLHADEAALPAVVDHHAAGAEGPVADQGKAPLSSAFAVAGAVEHALAVWSGAPAKVSVMQLWSRYHAPSLAKALAAAADTGLAPDDAWPFSRADAVSWLESCDKWAGPVKCGKPVDAEKQKDADGKLATTALDEEDLGAAVEVPQLRAKLAAGEDVLVALKVGPTFKPVGKPGAMYVPHYEGGKGAHALLVVGYATYPHGTYFLVKNSVGEKWGDQGYAWLHENTLKANIAHAYVVDARPADASKLKRKVHKPQAGPCKPGTFPDAISGACSPVCSDRGPRYDNVCPKKDECPKGQVNLWGECVLAAPAGARSEPKERELRYACGAGGCTFRAKRGVAGCEKETCPISCPAPTFRPMGGEKDVVCWE